MPNSERDWDGDILDADERDWYESEFLLADLGPFLDESRRQRIERQSPDRHNNE